VVRGTGVQVARAVADHLREHSGCRVGVLGVPWLRPFPSAEVARVLAGRRALAVVEAVGAAPPGGAPLFREVAAAVTAECTRISATCGGAGPEPAALAGLCELLRRPDPPVHVDLERVALPEATGFPRRDALLQSLANTDPSLREVALPEAEPPGADPTEGRSAGAIGLESELPPDALSLLAEAAAAACGSFVRGAETRPEPGVWEARVRAAARDFPDPGPRAAVSFLLVGANARNQLGNPLAAIARGGAALLATADPPEQLWGALPAAWRRTARERELRLFTAPPAFEAGLELLGAFLRGDEGTLLEAEQPHEVHWRELPALKAPDGGLPGLVRRIPRVRPAHDSLPRFWGEIVQPRQGGASDCVPDPLSASGAVPAGASALQPAAEANELPLLDPAACTGCGRCWSACPDSAIGATALGSEALLTAASRVAGTEGTVADALRRSHKHLADRLASSIAKGDAEPGQLDADTCREAWDWLRGRLNLAEDELPAYEEAFEATLAVIERLEPVVSEPLFREPEAENKGDGALLLLAFDPHTCLGCGLCVAACPDEALKIEERTPARVADLGKRWRVWEELPDTTGETLARAANHPDVGPLAGVLLSRHCGQAQIGGGDGEPGSGERLAGRLVVALVERAAQRNAADRAKRLGEGCKQLDRNLREGLGESLSSSWSGSCGRDSARASRRRTSTRCRRHWRVSREDAASFRSSRNASTPSDPGPPSTAAPCSTRAGWRASSTADASTWPRAWMDWAARALASWSRAARRPPGLRATPDTPTTLRSPWPRRPRAWSWRAASPAAWSPGIWRHSATCGARPWWSRLRPISRRGWKRSRTSDGKIWTPRSARAARRCSSSGTTAR
jgi:pyruvate-ferredoxin/flavodoxin oxidoreductase